LQDGFTGAAGFHAKGFFDKVVQIEKCWLQAEPTNAIRNFIRAYAAENGLSFYDIRRHTGFLRTMQVRLCRTGQTMVNIVLGEENEPARSKLFQNLMARFPEVTTWLYTINLKWNDAMHDLEPVVVSGNGYVVETLEGFFVQDRAEIVFSNQYGAGGNAVPHYPRLCRAEWPAGSVRPVLRHRQHRHLLQPRRQKNNRCGSNRSRRAGCPDQCRAQPNK
jgi:hypothetical protein